MVLKQRARRDEDKQQRRDAIVKAARTLFERSPRLDTTIAEVAERAGVAKGTVFLYFATREALELAVLDGELEQWFDALDRELEDGAGQWTSARVSAAIVGSVVLRKLMARLHARLETTLEHGAPAEQVELFRHRLLDRMQRTGALIERRLPGLKKGQGTAVLLRARALLTGLWILSDLAPAAARSLEAAEMAPLRGDFERDFEQSLLALLDALL